MDTLTEDLARSDVEAEMTMLGAEDAAEQNVEASDEVENLRNSLREAVHDDSVRPKMQCLLMDTSFSMVTMQGEDSGIAWETTASHCPTPWTPEAGRAGVSSPVPVQLGASGSQPAGKIIFVMDEEMIARQRKPKERVNNQKSKAEREQELWDETFDSISGRPELVEVSQPNVKTEAEGEQEEVTDLLEGKEQHLFRIVSEGSEILNIVVPPKFATVDEEESKEMVDNLSYLEESLVPKTSAEIQDSDLPFSAEPGDQIKVLPPAGPGAMDPPGAPVARPPVRGVTGNVDYFEAFSLIEAQAPGSPAVIPQGQEEPEAKTAAGNLDTEKPVAPEDHTTTKSVDIDKSDTVSLEEITSDLLDDVFYGGTESYALKSVDTTDEVGGAKSPISRLASKPSGSSLFGSQEDILTPIFLPEGPPKIIDQILLEEPKAMAFLYTDLYEEALGSRKKEEDTESMTSEKSFHSRHSDREARGYLEKFVLIDETPAVETEQQEKEIFTSEESRTLPQDMYDFEDILAKSDKGRKHSDEVTDFLRSSDNSSPCDIEPFPRSLEEDDIQTAKSSIKTQKSVSIATEKVSETTVDPLGFSSYEFLPDEPDWEDVDDGPTDLDRKSVGGEELGRQESKLNKPDVPPRRKTASSPKSCLDLTPLTPVDMITQEKEEAGGKEHRVEEKETASPVETADEGDGNGEDIVPSESEVAQLDRDPVELKTGALESESTKDSDEMTVTDPKQGEEEETKPSEDRSESQAATTAAGLKETDVETEVKTEKQEDKPTTTSADPAVNKRQCVIL
ncbi:PREDICTED: cardiomyopathy-associated protein 5-like [Poecilia mexicana]|uniref:cardiomyopathy-associated protein 5-like n=1 Tax=Poecilia mexicana TaxID=48701 RepID=UPI00072E7E30|nr:PREDICTED: cardiomyopathy-associated protein 5-like [Poecilia mexicana]